MGQPYVRWKYLNPSDKQHPDRTYVFEITKQKKLPFYSDSPILSRRTTFMPGKTVEGIPVYAEIIGEYQNGTGQGVLVREAEGFYILPRDMVKYIAQEDTEEAILDTKTSVEEKVSDAVEDVSKRIKKIDTKKLTGFTPRQLVVIAVVGLLTYQIFRK